MNSLKEFVKAKEQPRKTVDIVDRKSEFRFEKAHLDALNKSLNFPHPEPIKRHIVVRIAESKKRLRWLGVPCDQCGGKGFETLGEAPDLIKRYKCGFCDGEGVVCE